MTVEITQAAIIAMDGTDAHRPTHDDENNIEWHRVAWEISQATVKDGVLEVEYSARENYPGGHRLPIIKKEVYEGCTLPSGVDFFDWEIQEEIEPKTPASVVIDAE